MSNQQKILSEVVQLKALGQTMIDKATKLEALLGGEGRLPLSTRRGMIASETALAVAKRNKRIFK